MSSARKGIKQILLAAGIYAPIRRLNLTKGSRDAAKARARMRNFFAELLPKNALVFDIGANVGVISEAFASTGARVVALEPNVDAARHIELMYSDKKIQVIQAAVGSSNGLASLHISNDWNSTCTLSTEWMAKMEQIDGRYRGNWSDVAPVPVVTLDTLIEHFGEPYFIKIDVEGYELEVLRGLSRQPSLLSFEFHKTVLESALQCLELPLFADGSLFNIVESPDWGYPANFQLREWVSKGNLRNILEHIPGADAQGDVYVRRPSAIGSN